MIGYAFVALNLVAFLLIWRQGTKLDRVAVVVLVASIFAGAFAWRWDIGGWRAGTAMLNVTLFVALASLTERHDRWWLVFVSAIQLLITATHLLPFLVLQSFQMTGFVIRQILWGLITVLFFVAAWECWAARRFEQESLEHDHQLRGGL